MAGTVPASSAAGGRSAGDGGAVDRREFDPGATGGQLDRRARGVHVLRDRFGRWLGPDAFDDLTGGQDPHDSGADRLAVGNPALEWIVDELDHHVLRGGLHTVGVDVRLAALRAGPAPDVGIPRVVDRRVPTGMTEDEVDASER